MDDSQRLILEHFDMIHDSPSEIYLYAIPFSPSSSWLHKCYSPELLQRVKVVKGPQAEWGKCSRTVSLDCTNSPLVCWKDIIAACSGPHNIIILDAITGTTKSVLSGHTKHVRSLAFSLDGSFLVSGGYDKTVKLWDVQTGGVAKTFCGHTDVVRTTSISSDCITIASGSWDCTIRLWDTQTGVCHCVIDRLGAGFINFSPTNSQLLIFESSNIIQQWDVNGHQIGPSYEGYYATFSPDGTCFVSLNEIATVRNFDSGVVVVELQAPSGYFSHCCFSPNGKFLAGSTSHAVYIWDLTSSDPCLVKTFIEHDSFGTIAFSSSHIFSYSGGSIKFWPISTSSMDSVATGSGSLPLTPAPIVSIVIQANGGVAISTDDAGVVKAWDISTGLCKSSSHTDVVPRTMRDARLIDGKLISVWCKDREIHIDERKKHHQIIGVRSFGTIRVRISDDGSRIFHQDNRCIRAFSTQTGLVEAEVEYEKKTLSDDPLIVEGSRVWVHFKYSQTQGWDFGSPGSIPIPLSSMPSGIPHLDFIWGAKTRIEYTGTGKVVLQLHGRYAEPTISQWDGQYLVSGYKSGEVLILDFSHMILE